MSQDVLHPLGGPLPVGFDDIRNILYKEGRCGLYHIGQTGGRIVISSWLDGLLNYYPSSPYNFKEGTNSPDTVISLNVRTLIKVFNEHFATYIRDLHNASNQELRGCFETMFDTRYPYYLHRQKMEYADITQELD